MGLQFIPINQKTGKSVLGSVCSIIKYFIDFIRFTLISISSCVSRLSRSLSHSFLSGILAFQLRRDSEMNLSLLTAFCIFLPFLLYVKRSKQCFGQVQMVFKTESRKKSGMSVNKSSITLCLSWKTPARNLNTNCQQSSSTFIDKNGMPKRQATRKCCMTVVVQN